MRKSGSVVLQVVKRLFVKRKTIKCYKVYEIDDLFKLFIIRYTIRIDKNKIIYYE